MKPYPKLFVAIAVASSVFLTGCANKSVTPDSLSQAVIEQASQWHISVPANDGKIIDMIITPMASNVQTFPDSFPNFKLKLFGSLSSHVNNYDVHTPVELLINGNIGLSNDRQRLIIKDVHLDSVTLPSLHKPMTNLILPGLTAAIEQEAPIKLSGLSLHTPSDFLIQDIGMHKNGQRVILNDSFRVNYNGAQFRLVNAE